MSTTAFSSPNTSTASLIKKEFDFDSPSNLEDDKSKILSIFEKVF